MSEHRADLFILNKFQVTSVKFVANDEYALTGTIDKVLLDLHLFVFFVLVFANSQHEESHNPLYWNLALSNFGKDRRMEAMLANTH